MKAVMCQQDHWAFLQKGNRHDNSRSYRPDGAPANQSGRRYISRSTRESNGRSRCMATSEVCLPCSFRWAVRKSCWMTPCAWHNASMRPEEEETWKSGRACGMSGITSPLRFLKDSWLVNGSAAFFTACLIRPLQLDRRERPRHVRGFGAGSRKQSRGAAAPSSGPELSDVSLEASQRGNWWRSLHHKWG